MQKLNHDEIERALQTISGWQLVGETIQKTYEFNDFVLAIEFMTQAALKAEELQHHPDWSNVYNRVTMRLSTHDVGGLTELDFQLATASDEIAKQMSNKTQ